MDESLDQSERPFTEREFSPPRRAKKIGHQREICPGDIGEKQRRAACGNDTAMDLRRLETSVDGRGNLNQVVIATQPIEKRAEVAKHA
jgi:hypothetical protein